MTDPTGIQILDVGAYAKPASILIEKIADAIGGYAKPWQIKRVARAEADVKLVEAETDRAITDLEQRALNRLLREEARKQNSIESITAKALPDLTEEANPEDVEDDWIVNFFDKGRLISDDEMQQLWAGILAGEANSPGSYSKRTVNVLADLSGSDALLFAQLCGFGFYIGSRLWLLVYDLHDDIYIQHGITYANLSHFDSIGLVHLDNLSGFILPVADQGYSHYHGETVWLDLDESEANEFQLGRIVLTQAGNQLASICESEPVDGFVEYVREKWKSLGYRIDPPAAEPSEEDDGSA